MISFTGTIWDPPTVSAERAPDGPRAAAPLVGWTGFPALQTVNYTIFLSGAEFCDGAVGSESPNWGMIKSTYR